MNALPQLQLAFQRYLLQGDPRVREAVADGERVNIDRRLRIYHDAYRLRLIEALATDYEALQAVMGVEAFRETCLAYIDAHPSTFRNVRWFGGALPGFLRDTSPWSAQPHFAEIASFEWTLTLAFDAEDAEALSFGELAAVDADRWPTLTFVLHPSVQLIGLRSNAAAVRMAVDAGETLPEIEMSDAQVPWLVWRRDLAVSFRSLSEAEHAALITVRDGGDFTALCEALCAWYEPEATAARAAGLLRRWVDEGLIARVAIAQSND